MKSKKERPHAKPPAEMVALVREAFQASEVILGRVDAEAVASYISREIKRINREEPKT